MGENSINQLSLASSYLINNEYDPSIYGIQQVEQIDYDTLSLFSSETDKACLHDLLNSRTFVGEAEDISKDFLSD